MRLVHRLIVLLGLLLRLSRRVRRRLGVGGEARRRGQRAARELGVAQQLALLGSFGDPFRWHVRQAQIEEQLEREQHVLDDHPHRVLVPAACPEEHGQRRECVAHEHRVRHDREQRDELEHWTPRRHQVRELHTRPLLAAKEGVRVQARLECVVDQRERGGGQERATEESHHRVRHDELRELAASRLGRAHRRLMGHAAARCPLQPAEGARG